MCLSVGAVGVEGEGGLFMSDLLKWSQSAVADVKGGRGVGGGGVRTATPGEKQKATPGRSG